VTGETDLKGLAAISIVMRMRNHLTQIARSATANATATVITRERKIETVPKTGSESETESPTVTRTETEGETMTLPTTAPKRIASEGLLKMGDPADTAAAEKTEMRSISYGEMLACRI
jgi:hypothetical protein